MLVVCGGSPVTVMVSVTVTSDLHNDALERLPAAWAASEPRTKAEMSELRIFER
jgi:hypothetical protein